MQLQRTTGGEATLRMHRMPCNLVIHLQTYLAPLLSGVIW